MASDPEMDSAALLAWLVEAGVDEAIGEEPVDRFAARPAATVGARAEPGGDADRGSSSTGGPAFRRTASPTATRPATRGDLSVAPSTDNIGAAMDIAARCNSLSELKAALESFEGSQLKKNATKTVFADGNPESRILFVGEAPGREEDRVGLPFVGRAGKLLDRMLAAIGLDRGSAYIINVLPWRPPDNRNPEATEVAQCIPFLRRHIELAEPQIMILLGAVSLRHVLGLNEGIMKFRGRWMEYRAGERMIPVMPTLHPAYLLREPAHKRLAWRDLQAVQERLTALGLNRDNSARGNAGSKG